MWVLLILVGLLVVLAITAATGYFVAQEFAYMAVDRSRLKARAADGDAAAKRALAVTRQTSFMLSGAQLGITVTALLVGYVAEPLIGESLGTGLGGVGVPSGVGIAIGTVIALVFSTFVQMLFGELFPKNLAIAKPEPVAVFLATSTTIYLKLFGWLIGIFDKASNLLLKMVGIEPVHDVEHSATRRDLEAIVAESRHSGDLPQELSVLLDRIIDFPEQDVEHAMIPRTRIDVVRDTDTLRDVRELMSAGHSRYPVLDIEEEVVGVVHLQDVLAAPDLDVATTAVMRKATLVPESMTLPDALELLTTTRNQLACVLDEYGGLVGVVTLEDLAEELVGEITDEHDDEVPMPEIDPDALGDADGALDWDAPGDLHLDEVERGIGRDLPDSEHETLAGLVIEYHGALPEVGDVVDVPLPADSADLAMEDEPPARALRLEVRAVERHVPSQVHLSMHELEPDEEPESGESDGASAATPADGVDASGRTHPADRPLPEPAATDARPVVEERA